MADAGDGGGRMIKKDPGGQGYRVGGGDDPRRGFLLRPDLSIGNVLALVGILVGGIAGFYELKGVVAVQESRLGALERARGTADAAGRDEVRRLVEVNDKRFAELIERLKNLEQRLDRVIFGMQRGDVLGPSAVPQLGGVR